MPKEGEENDSGQRDQATKGWHSPARQGRNQQRQGNLTEFRQPLQVQSHLEVPRILVQLGHIQRT